MARRAIVNDDPDTDQKCKLSPVQQKVIDLLLAGRTYVESAAEAGVTDRTIRRWRESCPEFELELRNRAADVKEASVLTMTAAAQTVAKTLVQIATDPAHPQAIAAIRMLMTFVGAPQPLKPPTTVEDVRAEQFFSTAEKSSTYPLR